MSKIHPDLVKTTGEAIPDEWLERLFESLEMIFGEERFERAFPEADTFEELTRARTVWKNALFGCSYTEIKNALTKLKVTVKNHPRAYIPNHLEFYRICKGISIPYGYSTSIPSAEADTGASMPTATKTLVELEFDRQKRVSQEIRRKELKELYAKKNKVV